MLWKCRRATVWTGLTRAKIRVINKVKMYAESLPQLVQNHRDEIVSSALDRARREPDLSTLLNSRCDVAAWFHRIIESLERWPGIATDDQAEHFHFCFGEDCARSAVPLHQVVRVLCLLKSRIVDFAHSRGMARNALEIYVEEELENRVSFFFDWVLYHAVLGYEGVRPLHRDQAEKAKKQDLRDLPGWVPL